MKWVRDTTGRFAQRPHYDPAEIDVKCKSLISQFLRHGRKVVRYPISTDDLIVLLEREAADVDIYADLTDEGPAVEGATYFDPKGKPTIKIARHLAEDPWAINRFRTTATHELGHVRFHAFLWPLEPLPSLFELGDTHIRCRSLAALPARQYPNSEGRRLDGMAGWLCLRPPPHACGRSPARGRGGPTVSRPHRLADRKLYFRGSAHQDGGRGV